MKIAILGGAFDPPHLGHFFVAEQVKEALQMDEIWFVPCKVYNPNFHKNITASSQHRLNMVKLMEDQGLKASDIELKRDGVSYMIDTLNILISQRPDDQFSLIIGSDQLENFHQWKNWEQLVTKYQMIIFPRDTHVSYLESRAKEGLKLETIPSNIKLINHNNLIITNIASTKIRQRVKQGLSIKNLVTREVEAYISKNKLYEY